MSIANEHTDTFYLAYFDFKDPLNTTYIMAFWDRTPCNFSIGNGSELKPDGEIFKYTIAVGTRLNFVGKVTESSWNHVSENS